MGPERSRQMKAKIQPRALRIAPLCIVATVWLMIPFAGGAASLLEIYSFPAAPLSRSPLTRGNDGAYYGTTEGGGDYGHGSVFRITSNGVFTTIASFAFTNGAHPNGGLCLAR